MLCSTKPIDRGALILENARNKMQLPSSTKGIWKIPWLVFGLVFLWKVALFVFTAQPVPGNDAFFYDGPVVNYLLNGKYVNPALALTLPISGAEVFSAYPPLYQAVLYVWMRFFGTTALSAITFHVVLFGLYLVVMLDILRRLAVPAWGVNVAGTFLLVITFHDRPDSLAHLLGMFAVWGLVRSRFLFWPSQNTIQAGWLWFMAVCAVLCACTSLQVGAVYFCLTWLIIFGGSLLLRMRIPLGPTLSMLVAPCALVCVVVLFYPKLWAGFVEHARVTPSIMGLHMPALNDILKIARTTPGILAAALLIVFMLLRGKLRGLRELQGVWLIGIASVLTGIVIVVVCMFVWSANMVLIAAYLQPLAVACVLAGLTVVLPKNTLGRWFLPFLIAGALVGAIRAVGMSTWGVACAADVSHARALEIVRGELGKVPSPGPVVLSSAYLYEAATRRELTCVHSDWVGKFVRGKQDQELGWLLELRPPKLILTQFDYYRRYERVLSRLKECGAHVEISVLNTATTRTPDSYRLWQRVFQHVSWAPVVVDLAWR